ncbi:MAG: glycosyltransferase family 4 protein [Oligoflexia bacterium]|nr:glycosyltransferase family 4 protein [Oligoflexia bacterium]
MKPGEKGGICYWAVASHLGGTERSVLELALGLRARPSYGYEPWFVLPKEGPLSERLRAEGIRFYILPMPSEFLKMSRSRPLASTGRAVLALPGMRSYLRQVRALLREEKPSVIHSNALKCHALSSVVGPWTGIPVLWHLRDILPPGAASRALLALSRLPRLRGGLRVVANSGATARSFLSGGQGSGLGVRIVHNGIDPGRYEPRPNRAFNALLGAAPEVPVVGILGVLARWKGQLEFLRMAAGVRAAGLDARFAVIGGEIYDTDSDRGFADELRAEAERLGLTGYVHFTGFRDDPEVAINGLDVLVHASNKPEPFGRVAIEAMACGVPLVASAAGGILEIVDDERTGLLFPPGDVEALTRAVARLLQDAGLRARFREAGRAEFLSRFTSSRYVDGLVAVYDEMTRR